MPTNTRADVPQSIPLEIAVKEFKPHLKNTLQGFATLSLPTVGLVLHECPFHREASGNRWVGLPSRSYMQSGTKKWARLVDTIDKSSYFRFQQAAVKAIEDFLAAKKNQATPRAEIPK